MGARGSILLAAVLFGTTGTAQSLGPAGLSPLTVGAARVVLGGGLLALLALVLPHARVRLPPGVVLLSGTGIALYQLSFFEAVHRAGVAVAAVVAIGSGPVVAGLLERALGAPWPGKRWLGATALAIGGIAALGLGGGGGTRSPLGVVLALAAGAAYAAYTVVAKRLLSTGAAPVAVMGSAFGTAALLLLPLLALGNNAWLGSGRGVALAAYLALGPTVLAYLLFAHGLAQVSASETTTLVLAEPVTAALLGVTVLHERLGVSGVSGIALVLAGIALLARPGEPTLLPA